MSPGSSIAYNEVSTVLWEERGLLEGLAFTLEMQRIVLLPGNSRWVGRVCREVELALERLRPAQVARAVVVDDLGRDLGLGPAPTLRVLVESAEEPWREIFAAHRRAFLDLTAEVVRSAEHNRMWLGKSRASFFAASGWLFAGPSGDPYPPEYPAAYRRPQGDR
jgi:hypothetical protein